MQNLKTILFFHIQQFFHTLFFNCPFENFYNINFSFKDNIVSILKFYNTTFYELNEDLIVILCFDNTKFLFPVTCKGIWKMTTLSLLYNFSSHLTINLNVLNFIIPIYIPLLPNITKNLPSNMCEYQIFFNSLKAITDFNYLGNFNLDDIFYDTNNNYYLILNFECFEPKNPLIEVRLENLLNENKNIYFLNNQPLNSNDFYNFRNMGMI